MIQKKLRLRSDSYGGFFAMEQKRIIRYFAALQFLLYASTGLWNFCIIYFRDLGFSSREIGLMSTAGTGLSLLVLPFLGILGDRLRSPRSILIWMLAALIPLKLLPPVVGETLGRALMPFVVLSALNILAARVAVAMADAWAGEAVSRLDIPFGSVRMFGSLGYICASLLASALVGPVLPSWSGCAMMVAAGVPLLLLTAGPGGTERSAPRQTAEPEQTPVSASGLLRMVLRNFYFMTYLLLVLAFCSFLAIVDIDMTYLMDEIGAARSAVGIVGSFRAALEIIVMLLLGRARRLPPHWLLLALSGFLIAAEHLLYPSVHGLGGMLAATVCSGVAGGFYYGLAPNYVFRIVDRRAAATSMALLAVVQSLIGMVGAFLGGEIIGRSGVLTLTTAVGLLALGFTALFVLACLTGRLVLKLPYASERRANPDHIC